MSPLARLTEGPPPLIAVAALAVASIVLALAALLSGRRRARLLARLVADPELARAVRDAAQVLPALDGRLHRAELALADLSTQVQRGLVSPGVVHFRAYDSAGPLLSFALAILDRAGDGVVLTSLYGRTAAQIYCKRIANGRPLPDLGPEEAEALRLAHAGGGHLVWTDPAPVHPGSRR